MSEETEDDEVISMSALRAPKPKKVAVDEEIKDDPSLKSSIQWGFFGIGGAGCSLAWSAKRHGVGPFALANTAKVDFGGMKLTEEQKARNTLIMSVNGQDGAGKDMAAGAAAAQKYEQQLYELACRSFGRGVQRVMVCAGAGGGTGGGGLEVALRVCQRYMESVGGQDKSVGLMLTLPSKSEGQGTAENALKVFEAVEKLQDRISPIVLIDNVRILEVWGDEPSTKVFGRSNDYVIGNFLLFSKLSNQKGGIAQRLDRANYTKILDSGVISFGSTDIEKRDTPEDLSKALGDNLRSSLLVAGIDESKATIGTGCFVGHRSILDSLPRRFFEHAWDSLNGLLADHSTLFPGLYPGVEDALICYTMLGGLGMPEAKRLELKRMARV